MRLEASVNIVMGVHFQYLRTLLCVESLHEFETMFAKIGHTTITHIK